MVDPGDQGDASSRRRATLAKDYEQQYNDGLITQGEKYNKVVDAWAQVRRQARRGDDGRASRPSRRTSNGRDKPINSIYMMAHSGARGSPAQMKQLAGMRGLMAKPSGEIIETPDHLELQGRPRPFSSTSTPPTAPARASPIRR